MLGQEEPTGLGPPLPRTGPPRAPEPRTVQAFAWKAQRFLASLTFDHCPLLSAPAGRPRATPVLERWEGQRGPWSAPRPAPRQRQDHSAHGLLPGTPQGGHWRRLQSQGLPGASSWREEPVWKGQDRSQEGKSWETGIVASIRTGFKLDRACRKKKDHDPE